MFDVVDADGRAERDLSGFDEPVGTAVACLRAGVERADPERATREAVRVDVGSDGEPVLVVEDARYSLAGVEEIVVLGGGKGSDRVAAALVDALDGRVTEGVVVVDDRTEGVDAEPVDVRVGDHPVPSERGVEAAVAVRELAEGADGSTLVLAVVTGGASALLPAPADGVDLESLGSVTRALLDAGASVDELNAVRKHASTLKGGRLAAAAAPARVVTVAISDVVGDVASVIGSGPTVPDASTFADALAILDRYDVDTPGVREHLEAGVRGEVPESPGSREALPAGGYHVVASARTAVAGAVAAARDHGFEPCVLSSTVTGEAREAGGFHAAVAREVAGASERDAANDGERDAEGDADRDAEGDADRGESPTPVDAPAVLVSAGETTVTVRGDGTGGPNQEFVLGAATNLASGPDLPADARIAVAAVDTDGRDGASENAGAVLSGDALADRETLSAARDALAANDAGGFLAGDRDSSRSNGAERVRVSASAGGVLQSGATGTNVNDLRVVVVDRD